jgi:hypothetical protein
MSRDILTELVLVIQRQDTLWRQVLASDLDPVILLLFSLLPSTRIPLLLTMDLKK